MWFVTERYSDKAAQLIGADYDLVAPDILPAEVASAMLKATRRGARGAGEVQEILEVFSAAAVHTVSGTKLLETAFRIARQHGGSLYGGLYLALAGELDAPVVTADTRLAHIAKAAKVRAVMVYDKLPRP